LVYLVFGESPFFANAVVAASAVLDATAIKVEAAVLIEIKYLITKIFNRICAQIFLSGKARRATATCIKLLSSSAKLGGKRWVKFVKSFVGGY
jgi:hypothetical protein